MPSDITEIPTPLTVSHYKHALTANECTVVRSQNVSWQGDEFAYPTKSGLFTDNIFDNNIGNTVITLSKNSTTILRSLKKWKEATDLSNEEVQSFVQLNASYKKEVARWENKNFKITQEITRTYSLLRKHLSELSFDNCAVEINFDNSIKISLVFPQNKVLMITKSFSTQDEILPNDKVMYSYFINRQMIASDVTNFQSLVKGFKEYMLDILA